MLFRPKHAGSGSLAAFHTALNVLMTYMRPDTTSGSDRRNILKASSKAEVGEVQNQGSACGSACEVCLPTRLEPHSTWKKFHFMFDVCSVCAAGFSLKVTEIPRRGKHGAVHLQHQRGKMQDSVLSHTYIQQTVL